MSLPAQVQVSSALARGARYQGRLSFAALPRLRQSASGISNDLEVDVGFEQDSGSWLRGAVAGTLELECQSCLKRFDWPLRLDLALRLVHNDQEEARAISQCETCMVKDDSLALRETIEDEILLALPMTPRCGKCETALSEPPQARDNARTSPFAAHLQQLKSRTANGPKED